MTNFFRSLFKFVASLKLAVILLVMLASILAAATYYESVYDTKTAQHLVYHSSYFACFLGLLFINVLCSTLSRYPWKRHQVGFVVTHVGILILLIGSFLTMVAGVEGSISIEEGGSSRRILIDEPVFMVGPDGDHLQEIGAEFRWRQPTPGNPVRVTLGGGLTARVERYLHHSQPATYYVADSASNVAALKVRLHSQRVDLNQWVTAGRGDLPLGPATLMVRRLTSPAEVAEFLSDKWQPNDRGELQLLVDGKPIRLAVSDTLDKGDVSVPGTDLRVKIGRYLAHAVPKDGKLISKSDEPVNPMIEIDIHDSKGASQSWLLFARFPELNTRRASKGGEIPLRMLYSFDAPSAKHRLVLGLDSQGKVYSKVDNKPGQIVELKKDCPTGWMDIQFTVSEFVPHAREVKEFSEVAVEKGGENDGPASAVLVAVEGSKRKDPFWLERGDVISVEKEDGSSVVFGYAFRSIDLGFPIKLKEFHIENDPGTTNAAAYRSVVEVGNEVHTIQMNEPMVRNGFKFFQASFGETSAQSKVSIFTVANDPGIGLKYGGSILLVSGIAMMFYLKPYQIRNRRRPAEPEPEDDQADESPTNPGETS